MSSNIQKRNEDLAVFPEEKFHLLSGVEDGVKNEMNNETTLALSDETVERTGYPNHGIINGKMTPNNSSLENESMGRGEGGECSKEMLKSRLKRTCTVKLLKRRFPFLTLIPNYSLEKALYDFIAGFTVALTGIPQSIAYAAVAGLPLEYGLYSGFMGPFVYGLMGSVPQVTVGLTAVMALMTQEYTNKGGANYAIVLSFLAGCVELVAGLLNLGFLIDFISGPVISGFCSAAAVTVILVQLKGLLGLKFPGSSVIKVLKGMVENISKVQPWDTVLGIVFLIFLYLLMNIRSLKAIFKRSTCLTNAYVDRSLWFISTCRNALAVVFGCVCAYVFEYYGYSPFTLVGEIKSGIPSFNIPPFSFERIIGPSISTDPSTNWTDITNGTTTNYISFDTICADLGAGIGLVPLIAILEHVAIAKAFATGRKVDATQEILALGLGSFLGSFFGAIPITASFGRSSVQSSCNVRTPFANCFNGAVILLALAFLLPTFSYIPKPVLAAVIIVSVYPLIEYHEIKPMWNGRRVELIPFGITFLCCMFINMEYGILIGAGVHLLILAYQASKPKVSLIQIEETNGEGEKVIIQADNNIYFPGTESMRDSLTKAVPADRSDVTIIVDMHHLKEMDYTTLKMLKSVVSEWEQQGKKYQFNNVSTNLKKLLHTVLPVATPIYTPTLTNVCTTTSLDDGAGMK